MISDLDQLIAGVAQLETSELEAFASRVSLLLVQRKTAGLSSHETKLLQAINRGLPADVESRYNALQSKIRDETITPAEHEELIGLLDIVEKAEADRLQALFTLSQIRQVSLPELMQQLGIKSSFTAIY